MTDTILGTGSLQLGHVTLPRSAVKKNICCCVLLSTMWTTGYADFQLILQPLLVYLKCSNTMIGVISGASVVALFGTFMSPWISRLFPRKKWYLFISNIPYLLPIGIMGTVLVFLPQFGIQPKSLQVIILVMIIAHQFFCGFVALPSQEYTAACIPPEYRGRYLGISATTSSIFSTFSSAVGGYVLLSCAKPMSFGYLCILTWLICQLGYFIALMAKEIPVPVENVPKAWSSQMLKVVWENKPYTRVISFYTIAWLFFWPAYTFVPVYGFQELKMDASTSAVMQIVGLVARISFAALGGYLVDRFGPKRIFSFWSMGHILALLPVIFLHNQYGVYATIAIQQIFWAIWGTALMVLFSGLPKPEHRAGYYTIQLMIFAMAGPLGSIGMGRVLDIVSYRNVFTYSALGAVAIYPLGKWAASILSADPKAYS